jgi:hypothetical protein
MKIVRGIVQGVAIWALMLGGFALMTLPAFIAVVLSGDGLIVSIALIGGWVGGPMLVQRVFGYR